MSNQAERIKAFKLAQHARLQKQDEEEPWISSEELCTEGSSDEETHTSVKSSHRKPKRNPRTTEKRGISPLAQTPKTSTETESTSTYQDSKYLLPGADTEKRNYSNTSPSKESVKSKVEKSHDDCRLKRIDTKVERLHLNRDRKIEAHSSKKVSDSSDTDSDIEIDEVILWRPKRGSIKLPELPEGMPVEVTTVNTN